jgi:hypothetical protein
MEREELTEAQSQHMRAFIAALRSGKLSAGTPIPQNHLQLRHDRTVRGPTALLPRCRRGTGHHRRMPCPVGEPNFSTSYAVPDADQSGQDAKGLPYVLQTWYGIENMYGYVTVACRGTRQAQHRSPLQRRPQRPSGAFDRRGPGHLRRQRAHRGDQTQRHL